MTTDTIMSEWQYDLSTEPVMNDKRKIIII